MCVSAEPQLITKSYFIQFVYHYYIRDEKKLIYVCENECMTAENGHNILLLRSYITFIGTLRMNIAIKLLLLLFLLLAA